MDAPGLCSPSLNVVSNMTNLSLLMVTPDGSTREPNNINDFHVKNTCLQMDEVKRRRCPSGQEKQAQETSGNSCCGENTGNVFYCWFHGGQKSITLESRFYSNSFFCLCQRFFAFSAQASGVVSDVLRVFRKSQKTGAESA
jgi:hypothetical protein